MVAAALQTDDEQCIMVGAGTVQIYLYSAEPERRRDATIVSPVFTSHPEIDVWISTLKSELDELAGAAKEALSSAQC